MAPPIIGLLLLAAFVLAVIYGAVLTVRPVSRHRSIVKASATGLLAVIAVGAVAPPWLIAGLALGAVGDWCLSRPGQRWFLAGLVTFAGAHVAYILLMIWVGASFAWPVGPAGWALVGCAAGMGAVLFRHADDLRWPVVGYVAIIAAMGLTALTLPPNAALGVVAALLFIGSDAVLGLEMFVLRDGPLRRVAPHLVWTTYWLAQLCFLVTFSLMWIT